MAMIGYADVEVFRRPTVAIMSTGDEIVEPFTSTPLKTGQVRDANRLMLMGMTKRILGSDIVQYAQGQRETTTEGPLSGTIIDHGIVKDDRSQLCERFIEMSKRDKVDVVVCSGGKRHAYTSTSAQSEIIFFTITMSIISFYRCTYDTK